MHDRAQAGIIPACPQAVNAPPESVREHAHRT